MDIGFNLQVFSDGGFSNGVGSYGIVVVGVEPKPPFDRIILTAAVEEIPNLLINQLKVGGIMIIPVGLSNQKQSLLKVIKTEKGLDIKELMSVRFVQMKEGLVKT